MHRTVLTATVRGLPDPLAALDGFLDALEAHGMGLEGAWVRTTACGLAALHSAGREATEDCSEADELASWEAGELGEVVVKLGKVGSEAGEAGVEDREVEE